MIRFRLSALSLGLALTAVQLPSHALDSFSTEVGTGTKTQMLRVGLQSKWQQKWFESNGTHLSGYWDFNLAEWRANAYRNVKGQTQNLTTVGVTPVFRFENTNQQGWYFEGGIGANYLSELYDNNDFKLSTHFQFGDHIGTGYVFNNKLDVGFKIQHYSNGGYKKPNTGVNFVVLKAAYAF